MIRWIQILSIVLLYQGPCLGEVMVAEFMALNEQTLTDEAGEFDDWVELSNTSNEPVDLAGYYVSNDAEDPTLWQIPQGAATIAPKGHLILWLDNDVEQGPLHAPFKLAGEGGTLSVTAPDGETSLSSIDYPAQHPDIAFGTANPTSEDFLFLLTPTPGDVNDSTGVSEFGGVSFSRDAGVFRESFELSMSTITDGATIKYTTDGREPGLFAGKTFTDPLQIETSTTFTAAVYIGGRRISPLQTQIYLAVDAELASFDSTLPVVLIDARGHDFTKDTSLNTEFEASPVASAFFDANKTITESPNQLAYAGMHVRGASSRAWPKKQYRFETWGPSQEDRAVRLLGLPADADWILAAPYFDRSLMRNHLTFRWWEALGYESPRTQFFELFLDMDGDQRLTLADYQGIYVLTETIKRSGKRLDIGSLKPADDGSFEGSYAIEATNVNQHWVSRKGTRLKYVEPSDAAASPQAKDWIQDQFTKLEDAVFSDDFSDYRQVIDLPSHLDYDIMRELSRNIDGASTFMSFREGKVHMGPLWDYNQSYGLTSLFNPNPGWMTEGWNVEYMTQSAHWLKWWDQLGNDPDYQIAWNDRWVFLRESTLSTTRLLGDIKATEDLLKDAAERNFERWDSLGKAVWVTGGGTRADPGESSRDTFAKEVAYVNDWLNARLAWIDAQVPAPPSFGHPSGAVSEGFLLEIGETLGFKPFGGTIHYTTDGSDPRQSNGILQEGAVPYREPIPLAENAVISARARSIFGKWSSLRQATFLVGTEPASSANLTISEFHYNPKGDDVTEFIELVNRGDRAIDLTGVRLTDAVEFSFGPLALDPGKATLVVEDPSAFPSNAPVAGRWAGRLANGGETIRIWSATGDEILSFTYGDAEPWPRAADGEGSSLQRAGLESNALDATEWQASDLEGGTPGVLPESDVLSFAQWQDVRFEDPALNGPAEDPDQDGLANLIEYALGSDPLSVVELPQIHLTTQGFTVNLRHPLAPNHSARIAIETSSDLSNWQALTHEGSKVRDGQSVTNWMQDESTRYIRLRISVD